jgi:hypothetical protein
MKAYVLAAILCTACAALATADTIFPEPDPRLDKRFETVEFWGYLAAENNPGGDVRRTLILTKSETRRFDPVANLAFAENDKATYDECVALLDKLVKIEGVVVDRGGNKWVLVESVKKLH